MPRGARLARPTACPTSVAFGLTDFRHEGFVVDIAVDKHAAPCG